MIVTLEDWKAIAAIGHAASTDDERPIMTGIRLSVVGPMITALATDGYAVARNSIEAAPEPTDPSEWLGIIRARQALHVEKDVRSLEQLRSKKDHPDDRVKLHVAFGNELAEVTLSAEDRLFDDAETFTRRFDLLVGTFPDGDKFLDTASKPGHPATTVDPARVAQIAKTLPPHATLLELRIGDGRSPIHCTSPTADRWSAAFAPAERNDS